MIAGLIDQFARACGLYQQGPRFEYARDHCWSSALLCCDHKYKFCQKADMAFAPPRRRKFSLYQNKACFRRSHSSVGHSVLLITIRSAVQARGGPLLRVYLPMQFSATYMRFRGHIDVQNAGQDILCIYIARGNCTPWNVNVASYRVSTPRVAFRENGAKLQNTRCQYAQMIHIGKLPHQHA